MQKNSYPSTRCYIFSKKFSLLKCKYSSDSNNNFATPIDEFEMKRVLKLIGN